MIIHRCTLDDVPQLAVFNKQLIEDEKSDNPMNIKQLEERMKGFLKGEYEAYFFQEENHVIGYALVKTNCKPYYLRQFLIDRNYRQKHCGTKAFHMLLEHLGVTDIDIEVLSWNEAGKKFWEKCGFKEISRYMRLKK